MSKVLDICDRIKQAQPGNGAGQRPSTEESSELVDMVARRTAQLEEERRLVKRTILNGFVGACIVVPGRGLEKVHLHDISEDGVAFDIELNKGAFKIGEEVAIRIYLNNERFFPFVVHVSNIREIPHESVYRHGASFVLETINDIALHHFVKFIESVSTSMREDSGDMLISTQGE